MNSCKHEFIHVYYTKDNKPYDIDYPYSYEQYNLMCKCEKCGKKRDHRKEVKFSQPPNILMLSLTFQTYHPKMDLNFYFLLLVP